MRDRRPRWPRWSVTAILVTCGALVALLDDAISGEPLTWAHRGGDLVVMAGLFPLVVGLLLDRYWRMQDRAAAAQAEAVADERRRISRDLHDSLAQQLGYLHLKLDYLANADATAATIRRDLEQMRVVSNEAYEQIYGLLVELRSAGSPVLAETLLSRAKWVGARAGFDVTLNTVGRPCHLLLHAAQQIQYIFGEALGNIEKHGEAHAVAIRIVWLADSLLISLYDDGCGFDAAQPAPPGHFGLQVMQERAAALGAALTVTSAPEHGTTVTLTTPLKAICSPDDPRGPWSEEVADA